jgi:hypothetical protein
MGRWSNSATHHSITPVTLLLGQIKPNQRLAERLNNGISIEYAGVPPDWVAGRAETACH